MNCLYKLAGGASLVLLLSGCASLSGDGGFGAAAGVSEARTGAKASVAGHLPRNDDDARVLAAVIHEKLGQPLAADDAVQIALLNNRGLQASYWSLGVAEADLVQAGRLQNPVLDFKRSHGGGEVGIERTLTFNLIGLITAPMASRIEGRRYEQSKLLVANEALKVAADTRRAWVDAVASAQMASYAQQVEASAQASAELAERMRKAGNWSSLDQAREQAYHAQTLADVVHAQKAAVAAREKLTRLLGLSGEQAVNYRLPDHLPELPTAPRELADIEQTALNERLDIQAARLDTEQTASTLGLTRTTRFINVLDLGVVRNSEGATATRGYELSLEIPLFDWGSARVARAEATYMQSVNLLAQATVDARSEARENYADYRASYDLARHYRDKVVPLRKQISDQTLLRYNGMLMSVFELLADAREQATAVSGYIAALKDYWTAQANLEAALGGRLPTNKGVQP
ncbi:Outer membrane efflux protein [Duganella sacchari]|uniref:Outer membrane efflux protein n=1 Tax=Duganella sacchari TaxID=551987 RepID=A0A1M7R4R3_9BURK|nr:TolC family protein [Duganella sacchari]SHN40122.1 Outer membrane efflux protein [Duganella sacchari]